MLRSDCKEKWQSQPFFAINPKNKVHGCTFLISLHWIEMGINDIALWALVVKHAAWLYNQVPNCISGLTLIELLTKTKTDHKNLLDSMSGDVLSLCWIQNFRMGKGYQGGIVSHVLDNF